MSSKPLKAKNTPERMSMRFVGYSVEARCDSLKPHRPIKYLDAIYGESILTEDWRPICFFESNNPAGVPCEDKYSLVYLHSRQNALALGFTFIAQNSRGFAEVLVRIVPYDVEIETKKYKGKKPITLNKSFIESLRSETQAKAGE